MPVTVFTTGAATAGTGLAIDDAESDDPPAAFAVDIVESTTPPADGVPRSVVLAAESVATPVVLWLLVAPSPTVLETVSVTLDTTVPTVESTTLAVAGVDDVVVADGVDDAATLGLMEGFAVDAGASLLVAVWVDDAAADDDVDTGATEVDEVVALLVAWDAVATVVFTGFVTVVVTVATA